MAMFAPTQGGDFTPAPAGVQPAVCCDVVDLGLQETGFGTKHKILIYWQLNEVEPDSGKPFLVWQPYTFSMHEKSNLYADTCSWLGMRMTPDQAARCDIEKMIGRPCLLNLIHVHKGNSTYANINSIMPLPDGYPVPQIVDYTRHINRGAGENSKDVRNPHSENYQPQSSVDTGYSQQPQNGHQPPAQNGYQQPAPPPQQPPMEPHPNATAPAYQTQQQAAPAVQQQTPPQQQFQPDPAFAPDDDLPF